MVNHLPTNISSHDTATAWNLITSAQRITLLTHFKPDGDGISACAAFESFLVHIMPNAPKIEAVYPSKSEFILKRHPHNVLINTHEQTPDLLVAFDTANYNRLYYPDAFKNIPLINIDHHVSNSITGTVNLVSGTTSSTCELLFELMRAWKPEYECDSYTAECLLMGILYDTQVFQTNMTTPRTLRVAARLMDAGADLIELKQELLAHKDPKIIQIWTALLNSIEYVSDKAVISSITQTDLEHLNAPLSSLAGFVNFLAQISDIDVSVLLYEMRDGSTKVSLRSKVTDVNAIAGQFGGGGHKNASGIQTDMPLEEIKQKLISALS